MRQKIQTFKDWLRDWTVKRAEGKNAKWWLFGVAFAESSFFPIPPDFFLIAILMTQERVKAFFYAGLTTVGSVLGGMFGYVIGFFFFKTVGVWMIGVYHLEEQVLVVQKLFAENAFFAIFTAAFTPIPYKVFTIAAGLFNINVVTFIVASILGRGGRFFLVAIVMRYFGKHFADVLYRYFNIITIVVTLLLGFVVYVLLK